MPVLLAQQAAFDNGLGQLLEEQRYPVGAGEDLLEYNTSEFGRFRLQYNLDYSRGTPDSEGFLQYIVSLGAHGAHSY